jgi:two-component system, OmpR family, phosphate regulon response regulator PhoB
LRSTPETRDLPVLMLTAREEEADRLAGFEAGADDYMVKPFSVRELMHRIRSILRCREAGAATPATIQTAPTATPSLAGGSSSQIDVRLQFDIGSDRLWIDGVEAVATASEFAVLNRLLTRRTTTR